LYTLDNIRYCLLTWDEETHEHVESHAQQELCITGLYQWSKALGGTRDFPRTREEFEKYNVVHLNITPANLWLIPKIREMIDPEKTKLLLNVDHALDMWNESFPYAYIFLQEIAKADFVFGVEPAMCEILSYLLQRHVACLPHPSPVGQLKGLRVCDSRSPRVLISTHRYDRAYVVPWLACRYGMPEGFYTAAIGTSTYKNWAMHLYSQIVPVAMFEPFIREIADSWCCIESYTMRSYGRFTIECAALGIPVIGAACVASQKRLFPELTTEVSDPAATGALLRRLCTEPEFHAECGVRGMKEVEYYGLERCAYRMLDFLNGGEGNE
jgi:hypothetical protein